ncbi:MAG: BamA/TamA family outer membrane protein [Flavobacteriales bacterium]|nr:BamA/TamA family outer membrane protein [Flavobacteriales bacterium]
MSRALFLAAALLLIAVVRGQSAPSPMVDEPLRVAGFAITGNKATKERIILREMLVQEGDTLPQGVLYERMERSRQNLMNTGLFNTVTVLPLFIDMRQVIIQVVVNERWSIWPAPIFQLADPNFNTWWRGFNRDPDRVNYGAYLYKYNFRGRNETLFLKAQFGYTRQFGFRYKVPGIDRRQRWGASIGALYAEQAEVTAATLANKRVLLRNPEGANRTERKADAELTFRPAHDVRHFARIGFVRAEVADTVTRVAIDYFADAAGQAQYMSIGYGVVWDRRDLRAFPRKGHYAEARIDRLGIGLAGEHAPDITTAYATLKKWWRVSDPITLAASVRGKHTWGTPPYYVQEGLGYAHQVRGYEYYVVDGEHFTMGRANAVWQLIKPRTERAEFMPAEAFRTLYIALYLNLFADGGRVWDSRYAEANRLADEWLSGYGAGLDLVTSYDQVLRVEYTLNALGERGLYLHFTQPF